MSVYRAALSWCTEVYTSTEYVPQESNGLPQFVNYYL